MRTFVLSALLAALPVFGFAQVASTTSPQPDPNKKLLTVEASCGECNFDMEGKNCDLAVRIQGKPYFVDGVSIKEYGHPHDKNGFCEAVRKAQVQGDVVNGRFKATYFKLLPPQGEASQKSH